MGAKRSPLRAIAILSSYGSLTKPPYITDFPFSSNTGGCLSPEYSFYHLLSELHHLKFMLDHMTWLLLHQSSTPNTAHEGVPRCSNVRWWNFSLRSYTLMSSWHLWARERSIRRWFLLPIDRRKSSWTSCPPRRSHDSGRIWFQSIPYTLWLFNIAMV